MFDSGMIAYTVCFCPQVLYDDNPRPVFHVWEDCGEQVGGLPGPTSSRVHGGVRRIPAGLSMHQILLQ